MNPTLPTTQFALFQLATAGWIFLRLLGIAVMLPGFADRKLTVAAKVGGSAFLAISIAPIWADDLMAVPSAGNLWAYWVGRAGLELANGLLLGIGLQTLLLGVHVAGQMISTMAGLSLAGVYDASGGSQSPVTKLIDMTALALFLAVGGHRMVVSGILSTFTTWPPGKVNIADGAGPLLAGLLDQSLALGIQAALPILATLFVANVVMGILGRLMPQMNVLVMSSGLNPLLMIASLMVGLGAMAWMLQGNVEGYVDRALRLISG